MNDAADVNIFCNNNYSCDFTSTCFFYIARVKQVYGSPDGMFSKRFPFTGVEPGIVGFLPTKIPAMAVSDMEL